MALLQSAPVRRDAQAKRVCAMQERNEQLLLARSWVMQYVCVLRRSATSGSFSACLWSTLRSSSL